jgi:hypothetical protein
MVKRKWGRCNQSFVQIFRALPYNRCPDTLKFLSFRHLSRARKEESAALQLLGKHKIPHFVRNDKKHKSPHFVRNDKNRENRDFFSNLYRLPLQS